MTTKRYGCTAALIDDGRVLVAGGFGENSCKLDSTEVLDVAAMAFKPGPALQVERCCCSAVRLDSARTLVVGGQDAAGRHNTTEVLDVQTMKFAPGPTMLSRRSGCVAFAC